MASATRARSSRRCRGSGSWRWSGSGLQPQGSASASASSPRPTRWWPPRARARTLGSCSRTPPRPTCPGAPLPHPRTRADAALLEIIRRSAPRERPPRWAPAALRHRRRPRRPARATRIAAEMGASARSRSRCAATRVTLSRSWSTARTARATSARVPSLPLQAFGPATVATGASAGIVTSSVAARRPAAPAAVELNAKVRAAWPRGRRWRSMK
mmetsp:Transcript_126203/g.353427  ORF Transcript_126203/g.353427 Transcript_126203/m.353427 type:complete len:214 (+) Transcript_126203:294-935(+)